MVHDFFTPQPVQGMSFTFQIVDDNIHSAAPALSLTILNLSGARTIPSYTTGQTPNALRFSQTSSRP